MERAVGIEPTLMGWKPSAYADRPGPHLIDLLFASVNTLEESASYRASRSNSLISRINFNRQENFDRSRRGELNPPTSVWRTDVSPQHFTCKQNQQDDQQQDLQDVQRELNPPTPVCAHANRGVTATLHLQTEPARRHLQTDIGSKQPDKELGEWWSREGPVVVDQRRRRSAFPMCQRRLRQSLPDIFVPMGGEWFLKRAEVTPCS